MQDKKTDLMKKIAADLRALADDLEALVKCHDDGLDDEPMLDEQGHPTDMDPAERKAVEEKEYREGLASVVEANTCEEVTLEDIRTVLVGKKRAGFIKEVKALITEYDVARISDLPAEVYGEFIVKARAIGEAT